ncbi:hypothetical protein RHMOL_Rhmol10G0286200 [Rhododendron molle]|uniref:Uncharacterized protein n=1 Tax=Rhododendron molle TaxID=49168 RepID=A0ACC0M7F2_RHOML|nr:hypothetical protein RHMOL_Rhmol10G0286200 [Rhododendron molle]
MWMEALQAVKDMFPSMSNSELMAQMGNSVAVSPHKSRQRLLEEGLTVGRSLRVSYPLYLIIYCYLSRSSFYSLMRRLEVCTLQLIIFYVSFCTSIFLFPPS